MYYSEEGDGQVKPPVGCGLNRPCRVVLTGVHKKGKAQTDTAVVSAFTNKLKRYCSDMGAKFVSYEPSQGVWTFEVRAWGLQKNNILHSALLQAALCDGGGGGLDVRGLCVLWTAV